MSTAPSTPSNRSDLFDAPLTQTAYNLDTAYTEQTEQAIAQPTGRKWRWLLLIILGVNAALWFGYTAKRQTFGMTDEASPQANIAANKMVLQTSKSAVPIAPPAAIAPPPLTPVLNEKTVCMLWEFSNNGDLKRADNRLAEQARSGYTAELADEPTTY